MSNRNAEVQRLLASLNETYLAKGDINNGIPGLGQVEPDEELPHKANYANRTATNQLKTSVPDRSASATPTKTLSDSSSITTWPAAIKFVSKYLINDENAITRIKHLLSEQHQHEQQWWKQRQEIVTRHQNRAGSQTQVADILKELGGLTVPIAKVDEAADQHELDAYDRKVYKSMVQMVANCDSQLRKTGVPFFSIKHALVVSDKDTSLNKLDKGELRELQKRMLQHLEDLLSEE